LLLPDHRSQITDQYALDCRRGPTIGPELLPLAAEDVGAGYISHLTSYEHAYATDGVRALLGEAKHRMEHYIDTFVKVGPAMECCVCSVKLFGEAAVR
jgi:hypothetical protein